MNMTGNWTNEKIEGLLEHYEDEVVLWKVTHRNYHKKDVRQAALLRLSEKINISVADISKKIANLRTYYTKELSKEKRSKVSGSAPGVVYRSRWQFYETIDTFLRDQVMPRKAMSNMDVDSDGECEGIDGDIEDDVLAEDDADYTDCQLTVSTSRRDVKRKATDRLPSSKKQLIKVEDGLLGDASPALQLFPADSLSSMETMREDADDVYGKHIANELRMIQDPRTKQYIKYKIQGLFYEAQYGGNQYGAELHPPSQTKHSPSQHYGGFNMHSPSHEGCTMHGTTSDGGFTMSNSQDIHS